MFERWNFTVCSVTHSCLPIWEFERPSATYWRISSSRSVIRRCGPSCEVERSEEGAPALVKTVPSTVWRMAEASSPGSIDLTM